MKYLIAVLMAVGCCVTSPAAAQPSQQVLTQVQAADVLSDLLTYTDDRLDARADAMQAFLRETGKEDAYNRAKPVVREAHTMYYVDVLKAAVDFVNAGGRQYANPALSSMSDSQLLDESNVLQTYNISQFMHINQQRLATDSMVVYLDTVGEFAHYLTWARAKYPTVMGFTNQAAPTTPEQLAVQTEQQINSAQALAWAQAEARGMTRADFDRAWQQRLTQYRQSVAKRVEGVRSLANALASSPSAVTPPTSPAYSYTRPINGGFPAEQPVVAPPLPPTVQSSYTRANYQAANNAFWNEWNDNYNDVTNNYSGRRRR